MTRQKMLGPHVKRLLSVASDHSTQHLLEVELDLVQTTVLLGEAIEKLGSSFNAIYDEVSAQQKIVDSLLSGEVSGPECSVKLKGLNIHRHINAVITGLQFQDMTNQLIERAMKRVNGLRDALGVLGERGAEIQVDSDNAALVDLLNSIHKSLAMQSAELDGALHKSVDQKHMESGEIELF